MPVLVPPSLAREFQAAVEKMLVEEVAQKQAGREEAEFPDGGEDGGGEGGVLESDLQCGRAQQEASECGIQQRAAAGTTVLWFY